jgi:hypothetical protein
VKSKQKINMEKYSLKWPINFEDYSWELESKGWFCGLEVVIGNEVFKPTFYDPTRLIQDVKEDLANGHPFTLSRLIVIDHVCRELMESVIDKLAKTGELRKLLL